MEQYSGNRRQHLFDFDWYFTRELPRLKDRYTGAHYTYKTTKAGQRCPYALDGWDVSGWRKLDLPHDWLVEVPFDEAALSAQGHVRRGTAWYRKQFLLEESCRDKQILLNFDGIAGEAEIYLNGSLIRRHFSSYTPITVDVTDRVSMDAPNTLAIFVDRGDIELWAYEGAGISRHVHLYIKEATHVAHQGIWLKSAPQEDGRWLAKGELTVENIGYLPAVFSATLTLHDAQGHVVATDSAEGVAPANGQTVVDFRFVVDHPHLWDVNDPALYTVRAAVESEGRRDEAETVHGFRTVAVHAERGFLLNGRVVKVHGVCCHQGHGGMGIALPDSIIAMRMQKLQEIGINAMRCVHHPHQETLLDVCDRLGILVMEENRHFETGEEFLGYLRAMVLRARNHPSVVFYSLCNEEPLGGLAEGGRIYRRMAQALRDMDDTRLLTGAMNRRTVFGEEGAAQWMDVAGINYELDTLEEYHLLHPHHPLIGSENAAVFGTRGQYVTDRDRRMIACTDSEHLEIFDSIRDTFAAIAPKPYVAGLFIWCGFDYRGEAMLGGWPAVSSQFGLMDSCGYPKGGYYYMKAFLDRKPFVKLLAHWNHQEGDTVTVYTVTNCDAVELLLNGRSLGKKTSDVYRQLIWDIPFAPGSLAAVAYAEGNPVAEDVVITAGKPCRLVLCADRHELHADGADTVMVEVRAVDDAGNWVPQADAAVCFTIEGQGVLQGCANGDPTSHEVDALPRRKLFAGLCAVYVRTKREAGAIRLMARADGMEQAEMAFSLK